jgi:predicted GNAT family acetyltransferase
MTVRDNTEQQQYEVDVDGELAGWIVYRQRGDTVAMLHTEVEPEHEGKGVGAALVQGALDGVRARGLKVQPLCPFVAAYIKRHPDYDDLVTSGA